MLDTAFRTADEIWQDGFVHVIIRQLPSTPDVPPNKVKLELAVVDTGKVCDIAIKTELLQLQDNRESARNFSWLEPIKHQGKQVVDNHS